MTWDVRLWDSEENIGIFDARRPIIKAGVCGYLEAGVQDGDRVLQVVDGEPDLSLVGQSGVQPGLQVLQRAGQPPVLVLHCGVRC